MSDNSLPHNHGEKNIETHLRKMLAKKQDFNSLADTFKLLDDSSRLRIFWTLCHCEECVLNIASLLEMTSPAVSHHLKLLKSAGLIVSRRGGKEVYYKVPDTELCRLLHKSVEKIMSISCPE